jgi:hypothetical protein
MISQAGLMGFAVFLADDASPKPVIDGLDE